MNKHYLVLDAARGIAAIAVVLYHVQTYIYPEVVVSVMPHLLHRSFLAVDLFFLMSGLVIARSYKVRLLSGKMSFLDFFRTRLVRLWPLYLLGTILGFVYAIVKSSILMTEPFETWPNISALVLNAVFFPSVSDRMSGIFPYNPAAWSLAFEWAINLVYAVWAVRQNTRILTVIALVSGMALVPCAISYGSLDMGWGATTFLGGTLRICFAFTLGVVIYRLLASQKLRFPAINPLFLLGGLAFVLMTPIGAMNVYYDLFCNFVVFPLFVILACSTDTPAFLTRVFSGLGMISYALYILHNPIMSWFGGAWKFMTHKDLMDMPALSGPLLLTSIFIGSYLTTIYFDEPVRRLLSDKTKKQTAAG